VNNTTRPQTEHRAFPSNEEMDSCNDEQDQSAEDAEIELFKNFVGRDGRYYRDDDPLC
jgi:hypothetical protein